MLSQLSFNLFQYQTIVQSLQCDSARGGRSQSARTNFMPGGDLNPGPL